MAYASTVWLASVAALCPSQDSEGDGTTTLTDFTSVSNGVCTNMATIANNWVTDGGQRALFFDGTNDHVVTEFCPLNTVKKITLSYWFRRTGAGVRGPGIALANALGSSTSFTVYPFEDGRLYIQYSSTAYAYFTLNDASWHHVCICFDGGGATNADRVMCFVDGVQQSLTFFNSAPIVLTTSSSAAASRLWLGLGIGGGNYYGTGYLDDLRLLGRGITSGERAELVASRGGTYAAASGGGGISQLINGGLIRGQVS